jgi:hypothetical protein
MQKLFTGSIVLLIILFSFGCSKPLIYTQSYKEGNNPQLNKASEATIGSTIYEEFSYRAAKAAIMKTDVHAKSSFGMSYDVPAGMPCYEAPYENEMLYCSEARTARDPFGTPVNLSCFKDTNGDGKFDKVTHNQGISMGYWSELNPPVQYEIKDHAIPDKNGIKRELLYQGKSNKVIKIVYREFVQNMARPAFTQELQYTLDKLPMEISFKKSIIKVTSADNKSIQYIVYSKFGD